jgi:succinoglycan biosynthesis protein ExoM
VTRSAAQDARGRRSIERGIGMVTGVLGHVVYEYRRD